MTIIKTECTRCHNMVDEYIMGDVGLWWGKYVKKNERVCLKCLSDNPEFIKEFKEKTGARLEDYLRL